MRYIPANESIDQANSSAHGRFSVQAPAADAGSSTTAVEYRPPLKPEAAKREAAFKEMAERNCNTVEKHRRRNKLDVRVFEHPEPIEANLSAPAGEFHCNNSAFSRMFNVSAKEGDIAHMEEQSEEEEKKCGIVQTSSEPEEAKMPATITVVQEALTKVAAQQSAKRNPGDKFKFPRSPQANSSKASKIKDVT